MMLAESADPTSDLFGAVDSDRVFVSGHSRGGGASLISLWERPSLMGAVCFEQVSPLQAPNQDWDDPARNGNRPSPSDRSSSSRPPTTWTRPGRSWTRPSTS